MKKLLLSFFCFGVMLAFNAAYAQNAPNSMGSGKDEFWGTSKTNKGAATDEVGARAAGLDTRYNEYETRTGRKSAFDKNRIKNSKKMKEIERKEKLMHKKHRKDKRMLARNRR
ncbi:hypothetical protein [Pontibacter fetidus]|uniref:Uncharacterized protein n=1 Tax=Pontibacter fetidus TaxID=2700082 RepID=A0A6B2H8Z5_9BACT|nr:hypothetical protein [Pontibacter fetidus]NDK57127.1 hypothetical protein [Pontibacter fetidus]